MTQNRNQTSPVRAAILVALAGTAAPALAQQATVSPPPVVLTDPAAAPVAEPVAPPPVTAALPMAETWQSSSAPAAGVEGAQPALRVARPAERSATTVATTRPVAERVTPSAPLAVEPVGSVPPQPVPAAPAPIPAPVVAADPVVPVWLWAALAALAALAAAAAFALSRRRLVADTAVLEQPVAEVPPTPTVRVADRPAMLWDRPVDPSPSAAPVMPGMGRHERAALRGPSADNPFLTRRNRVKRARFFDRQERLAAEAGRPGVWTRRSAEPAPVPQVAPRARGRSAFDAGTARSGGFKPAFSR